MAKELLRHRRIALGLTQGELAERAGVSRQLVAAVEAGRNTPSVDAALRLAAALGTTVERLFSASAGVLPVRSALGGDLAEGMFVRVAVVGEDLVAAPVSDCGRADGVVVRDGIELFEAHPPTGLLVAGCDPVLGIAEALLPRVGDTRLATLAASSGEALRALREGRIHGAVVHGPPGELPGTNPWEQRVRLARWPVGLAMNRPMAVAAVLESRCQIVQRSGSAASQQALARAADSLGLPLPPGPVAGGHLESARLGQMLGVPSLTTEAAARMTGQQFVALELHAAELRLRRDAVASRVLDALGETLRGSQFSRRASQLAGYELEGCGTLV
jgi:DNA-binding XRE family transcriptional regulator